MVTDANGLYQMRARYYNPEIKAFINEDDIVGSIEKSQSLNRYAYANGNPVINVDPEGHFIWNLACGVVGAVVNMAVTVAADLVTGDDISIQEVAAAGVGGFAAGVVASTGNVALAAYTETVVTTAVEAGLNKLSGVEKPAEKYIGETFVGLAANLVGGKAAEKLAGPVVEKVLKKTSTQKLTGAAANPKYWSKPTTIRGALTGNMAKRNYIDEALGFPFAGGGNIANNFLFNGNGNIVNNLSFK